MVNNGMVPDGIETRQLWTCPTCGAKTAYPDVHPNGTKCLICGRTICSECRGLIIISAEFLGFCPDCYKDILQVIDQAIKRKKV